MAGSCRPVTRSSFVVRSTVRHFGPTCRTLRLGCALVKTGRWGDAAPQFEAAVAQLNSSAMMHCYLALVYERTSRDEEAALAEFQDALRRDPKNFPANLLLGRMYVKRQKAEEAIPLRAESSSTSPGCH
ncbi:MAG TPA: tetratricopeptide repeat protein [Terriglobales bacterium]|nr:tetratricopeptide repeat protein [Terriglobales bacterium]